MTMESCVSLVAESRYIEAFATWGAALVILLTPIAMVAGFVLLIVATVKGRI